MSDYNDDNRGAIWPARERPSDKHPHFTGRANIDGVEYYVSAWKKQEGDKPKAPSLRFSFRKKEDVDDKGRQQVQQAVGDVDEDDIPF